MESKSENDIAKQSPILIVLLIVGVGILLTALLFLAFGMAGRVPA
jgi:hypothetical protein